MALRSAASPALSSLLRFSGRHRVVAFLSLAVLADAWPWGAKQPPGSAPPPGGSAPPPGPAPIVSGGTTLQPPLGSRVPRPASTPTMQTPTGSPAGWTGNIAQPAGVPGTSAGQPTGVAGTSAHQPSGWTGTSAGHPTGWTGTSTGVAGPGGPGAAGAAGAAGANAVEGPDPLLPPDETESKCEGKESQYAQCTMEPCGNCKPKHCKFGEWDNWRPLGGCSGLGTRRRVIFEESNECGRPCQGPIEETLIRSDFQMDECLLIDQDCKWGAWSDWSACGDCDACDKDRLAQSHRTRTVERQAMGDGVPCSGTSNQTIPCGMETPIDCLFTEWSEWTQCSHSCGGGWRAQIRRTKREAKYGGMPCEGNLRETFPCNEQPCGEPQNCEIDDWTDWTGCSGFHLHRNAHQMMRQRMIKQYAANGGEACQDCLKETMGCPDGQRIDWCTYSPWTDWTPCTTTCDGGQQERSRTFRGDSHCKQLELAPLRVIRGCNHAPCEGSCKLSLWSEWTECSQTCGTGMTMRTRSVESPASGGRMCMAAVRESKGCLARPCGIQDCKWGDWEAWGHCTSPCAGGIRRRVRQITTPPQQGGAECTAEDKMEVEGCNLHSCEDCIDGEWSNWNEWTQCSGTCFPAYRNRHRSLMTKANHCGKQAVGPNDEYELCTSLTPCEETQDCKLSTWTAWTDCSSACFGVRERHRSVLSTASRYGRPCEENDVKEVMGCNPGGNEDVPTECLLMGPAPCMFGHWESWSSCSATCDGGQKTRMRTIISQGMHGGAGCEGRLSEMAPCDLVPCDPDRVCVNCEWSPWSEWGACSGCGGQRYRQRTVLQTPNWCGRPCEKDWAKETQLCSEICNKAFCAWSEWREVGDCSATCGTATKMRTRRLRLHDGAPANESDALMVGSKDMECDGHQTDQVACSWQTCDTDCVPVDCALAEWSEWSEPNCNQLCTRHRLIDHMNECNGAACNGTLVESKSCRKDCGEVLNCVLNQWEDWSLCHIHQSNRKRTIQQEAKNGGLACPGALEETRSCATDYSAGNCVLEPWGMWSSCTKLCDGGTRSRERRIETHSKNGGMPCSGHLEQFESCHDEPCANDQVRDCVLSQWTEWMHCDSNNQQKRRRQIDLQPLYGGRPCNGSLHELRPCTSAIDCKISPWAPWDECDKSCDGGQQQRQRQVVQNPRNGGKMCPRNLVMIRGCNSGPCPSQVNCKVSTWQPWSECSATCGAGVQERSRSVMQKLSHCGEGCMGNLTEVRACPSSLPPCTDCKSCKWGEWGPWTSCSRHCGGGQHHRVRNITRHPDPGCGACDARDKVYTRPCNVMPCSDDDLCIDGEWNDWQDWATCSASCEGGETYRTRSMRKENTACGKPAEGLDRENGPCMLDVPCTPVEDCKFSTWGEWTDCSASCAGVKKRSRTIAIHGRGKDGKYCEGPLKQTSPCAFGKNQSFLNWRNPNLYMVVNEVPDNNLESTGPNVGGAPYIRFDHVVVDPSRGTWLDLLVSVDTSKGDVLRHYSPADSSLNGRQGVFGNINLRSDTMADLTFEMVETGTMKGATVNDLMLKFFDLDKGSSKVAHFVQVHSACEEYYTVKGTHYIVAGDCSPSGNHSVEFRKPIVAAPGCENGNAFDFDLSHVSTSNLAGKGPDTQKHAELRYERAAVVRDTPVDLVVTLRPGSNYEPRHVYHNGYDGRFGRINLMPDGDQTLFIVRFVNSNTKELFKMPKVNFTFFDIDSSHESVRTRVEASNYEQWYYPNGMMKWNGNLNFHKTRQGMSWTSTKVNVTNPATPEPTLMSREQEASALTLFFEDTEEFGFGLWVMQKGPTPGIKNDRDFKFAGKYCVPWPDQTRRLSPERGLGSTSGPILGLPDLTQSFSLPKLGIGAGAPAPGAAAPLSPVPHTHACPHGPVKPEVQDVGPASLTPEEERRTIAIRFRGVQKISMTLGVNKGSCGHNFLFAGKVCVSGSCDDCAGVTACTFSTWDPWGTCDKPCGGGSMNRSRDVQHVPRGTGQVAECEGPIQSVKSCNTQPCGKGCTPADCKWGDWTNWTPCQTGHGARTRHRGVAQMPFCGGLPCEMGNAEEVDTCEGHFADAKTYCAWESWAPWTKCSVTCGCGRKQRTRKVKRVTEAPDQPMQHTLSRYDEYDQLKARVESFKTRRVQVMVASFAAGCLAFLTGLSSFRSCRRLSMRRAARQQEAAREDTRAVTLL